MLLIILKMTCCD